MQKLKYTFKTDTLFKLLFTKHPHLLKKLVAQLLGIPVSSITQFEIRNPEMPPDNIGRKYCYMDIHMEMNGQHVNLEVQVENEGNFLERVLFYWAKIYSNTLPEGSNYKELPRTIIISIVDFTLFDDSAEFHSEFRLLEVKRKTHLIDKQILHFFELPKLPDIIDKNDILQLWLALFKANTEEELQMIDGYGVDEINEVVTAYRKLSQSPEFNILETQRIMAEADEAQRMSNAEERGEKRSDEKWESVVSDKDAALADKDTALADKDAALADKELEIEQLRKQLTELQEKAK